MVLRGFLLISFCILLAANPSAWGQTPPQTGFTPSWKVGDHWILEATYRDMKSPGEVWMPPVKWVFQVKSIKNLQRQDCYVLHVFPKNKRLKMQAILYLSTIDLRPMKVIEIFPTPTGVANREREVDPFDPQPLFSDDTLIPYDLPVFPLIRSDVQAADGFGAYRSPEKKKFSLFSRFRGFKFRFKKSVSQGNKAPERKFADAFLSYKKGGETFQVELSDDSANRTTVQMWHAGLPWAVSSESGQRKVKLILPSNPTPLPTRKEGE